jgi:chemotaxis regulatin CheY-phosphate phosphatase CheZ
MNKNNAVNLYIAKALDIITQASKNDTIRTHANELHHDYMQALKAKDLDLDEAKNLYDRIKKDFTSKAEELAKDVTSKADDVLTYAERIKKNISEG